MRSESTQHGFSSGEWSPLLLGQGDLPRYQQCAETIENALVILQGGATRRWGTRYIASAKFANKKIRLMSFRFSASQAYVLELGDLYARFYTQSARIESSPGVAIEAVTPWTEAQLPDLEWVQYADTAIVVHPNVVPYRIIRISSTQWKIQAAPFVVFPSTESGIQPASQITLSATSGAITITVTAGPVAFLASDVGRQVIADIGEATITGFVSTTQVNATATGFQSLIYASQAWTITESPKTILTLTAPFTNKLNSAATLTLSLAGWRASDVGSYVLIEDGQIEITAFSTTTVVTGKVREPCKAGTVATSFAESKAWTLEPKAWSATRGYPRAVSLHEQRLVFGGTAAEPVTFWASPTGKIYDLSRGFRDAAGFTQQLFAYDMSTIMHLVSAPTTLLALTASTEMTMGTGNDAAMSPTNIHPRTGALNGASNARPVLVNNDVIYAQDGGTKIRSLAYQIAENALWSPDISWEAEHLFKLPITELCYSKRPHPQLYAVRSDGVLLSCALYRQVGVLQHDVLAWAHQSTQGSFISCAIMPEGTEGQLWLGTQRTVGGSTVTFIELADYTLNTDAAVTGSGAPSTTWSGFSHLEGKTLNVLGDGIQKADAVVTGGAITVDRPITKIEAGLSFASTIKIPELELPGYSIAGSKVRVNEVIVDVFDTIGIEIQGNDQRWFSFGPAVLDQAPPALTGKRSAPNLGWDGGAITVRQVHPYKWTVRRIIRRYTSNEK